MSSPNIQSGGQLIQIGLSVWTDTGIETIAYYIRPEEFPPMEWDLKAAEVHQISQETLKGSGYHRQEVDEALYEWLISKGADPKHRAKTIPVGFNIGGFDMPFVRQTLPKTYSLLSRRVADLNGMLWLLNGKNNRDFESWKELALEYAKINMNSYKPHDAGWDSARHLLCYSYLKSSL